MLKVIFTGKAGPEHDILDVINLSPFSDGHAILKDLPLTHLLLAIPPRVQVVDIVVVVHVVIACVFCITGAYFSDCASQRADLSK